MDTAEREISTAIKLVMHCDVISMIFSYYSKPNFSGKKQNEDIRRSYQPILHQLYTEAIKLWGGISLHKQVWND